MEMRHVVTEPILFEPPPVALYIMLQMEIRSALTMSDHRVYNLYQQFRQLATTGSNPSLTALVQTPTIWNAFLLAFCKRQQFASASQLVKDMMDGQTQPNVYSWNILMQAFFKTGQVQAADRVFEIMRNKSVDPDQFSYGILLRGYAKAQLVERIGDTMQHVETAEEMDPDLLRALAKVVNRKSLMFTLEKSRLDREARAQAQLIADAEVERQRWEFPQLTPTLPVVSRTGSATTTTSFSTETPMDSQATGVYHVQKPTIVSKESPTVPSEPVSLPQEQNTNDEDIFSFLQKSSTRPQRLSPSSYEPSVVSPDSSEITRELQELRVSSDYSASNKPDPYDPEFQYRKLQEQLGIASPTSNTQAPAPSLIASFGANLGFKSMLPAEAQNQPVAAKNTNLRPKSMLPGKGNEFVESKRLPKVKVRRVMRLHLTEKEGKK